MKKKVDPNVIKAAFEKTLVEAGMSREEAAEVFYEYLVTILEAGKRIKESKTTIDPKDISHTLKNHFQS